ncbi:uncharacterized protein LOC117211940 [Bombus bifarius]|uniref:Uncharacterized protein LOC117211940 n=1 Tax=Bombus bifarius TaxID=103933 RepID=A0A6P8MEC6_9HYME|nr:uncharacterized protein LOC117211940 [Bombus bifarius]
MLRKLEKGVKVFEKLEKSTTLEDSRDTLSLTQQVAQSYREQRRTNSSIPRLAHRTARSLLAKRGKKHVLPTFAHGRCLSRDRAIRAPSAKVRGNYDIYEEEKRLRMRMNKSVTVSGEILRYIYIRRINSVINRSGY